MLSYDITGFTVAVKLTHEQWGNLLYLEEDCNRMYLYDQLEQIGASKIDWSGHYGQYIYFECNTSFNESEHGQDIAMRIVKKIEELLK